MTKHLFDFLKDDIPYQLAFDAHRQTSFVPEHRANQVQAGYINSNARYAVCQVFDLPLDLNFNDQTGAGE